MIHNKDQLCSENNDVEIQNQSEKKGKTMWKISKKKLGEAPLNCNVSWIYSKGYHIYVR